MKEKIEYDKFQKSLKHLELQFENYTSMEETEPVLMREAVAESVIQRFETCYDCMWKVLKRYLKEELGIPDVPNSPKPILRLGNENSLYTSSMDKWISYADARIGTSHDYSGEKAGEALALMKDFIDDAISLYKTMSGESWQ